MLPCDTGLGVRIVLIIGARQQIDELLEKQGEAPQYAAGYRITDSVAMQTAVQAAGASRMAVEAQLSKVNDPTPITKNFALPDT
jgi:amino-acid N-acetyltransferase